LTIGNIADENFGEDVEIEYAAKPVYLDKNIYARRRKKSMDPVIDPVG